MQYLGRLLPLTALAFLVTTGCQSPGAKTAQIQRERDELNVQLAAATRQLDLARDELASAISDVVKMKHALSDHVSRLLETELRRQDMERQFVEIRRKYGNGECSDDEMTAFLREYLECMVQTGIEETTANEVMTSIHSQVADRMTDQDHRLEDLIERIAQLQRDVKSLKRRIAEIDQRTVSS
jgi:chromosome segregation ATPase